MFCYYSQNNKQCILPPITLPFSCIRKKHLHSILIKDPIKRDMHFWKTFSGKLTIAYNVSLTSTTDPMKNIKFNQWSLIVLKLIQTAAIVFFQLNDITSTALSIVFQNGKCISSITGRKVRLLTNEKSPTRSLWKIQKEGSRASVTTVQAQFPEGIRSWHSASNRVKRIESAGSHNSVVKASGRSAVYRGAADSPCGPTSSLLLSIIAIYCAWLRNCTMLPVILAVTGVF